MEITAPKTRSGKILDFISVVGMVTFGLVLAATVGFVLLYYSLFYLNYIN
jgi:hypothetical protein